MNTIIKFRMTKEAPKNINVSWDSIYKIEPLNGATQEQAELGFQRLKKDCGEAFSTLLLRDGDSDTYAVQI